VNCLGLIGFNKNWLNVLFGLKIKKNIYIFLDLTLKEIILVFLLLFFIVFFVFFSFFFLF
jgi:hypothetical protein